MGTRRRRRPRPMQTCRYVHIPSIYTPLYTPYLYPLSIPPIYTPYLYPYLYPLYLLYPITLPHYQTITLLTPVVHQENLRQSKQRTVGRPVFVSEGAYGDEKQMAESEQYGYDNFEVQSHNSSNEQSRGEYTVSVQ